MANSISALSRSHKLDVVQLHRNGIKTGFLSTTGDAFLKTLYCSINRSPYSRVYCAIDDDSGKTVGFIAGAISTTAMYRQLIIRYGIIFFILLLPNIFKISNIKKILETLFYTKIKKQPSIHEKTIKTNNQPKLCDAELLSVVVDESARGQKIGKKLVDALEKYFAENNVFAYKVVTYSKDSNANAFYQSCGFIKHAEFIHHGNLMFEYTKSIV